MKTCKWPEMIKCVDSCHGNCNRGNNMDSALEIADSIGRVCKHRSYLDIELSLGSSTVGILANICTPRSGNTSYRHLCTGTTVAGRPPRAWRTSPPSGRSKSDAARSSCSQTRQSSPTHLDRQCRTPGSRAGWRKHPGRRKRSKDLGASPECCVSLSWRSLGSARWISYRRRWRQRGGRRFRPMPVRPRRQHHRPIHSRGAWMTPCTAGGVQGADTSCIFAYWSGSRHRVGSRRPSKWKAFATNCRPLLWRHCRRHKLLGRHRLRSCNWLLSTEIKFLH